MKHILFAFFCMLSITTYSQGLNIYNSKSQKHISTTDHLEVGVKLSKQDEYCDIIRFYGAYRSSTRDSITFEFDKSETQQLLGSKTTDRNWAYMDNARMKSIGKDDILYMRHASSRKAVKNNKTLSTIGGLIVVGGIATAVNALVLADNHKKHLLVASALQIGVGLSMAVIFSKPKARKFKETRDPWKFKS